ncbi:MAG: methyltransferase domain-containing protein [Candidatus Izimaplasma sp.]|nr:methyltransferase domain-containing protein [Candidatus Izimaplasma bacterium]
MNKLKTFLMQKNDAKILDVGTGNGNFIRIIASLTNEFSEIIGIDLIEGAVEGCKKNFEDDRINFFTMDAMEMEFDDDSFDLVCLSNSLHHLEDVKKIMIEMERVLKPGGALVFCEMMSNNLNKRQKSHLLMHHYAAEVDRHRGRNHGLTFTNKRILEILQTESTLMIKDAWDLTYPRREDNSEEEIEWLFETIDRVKEGIIEPKKKGYFEKEADKVKKHIKKYGFDSATQLIVILK